MKTFEIHLSSGQLIKVEGEMIQVNDETGQAKIYTKNDPVYSNVAAVIPADALIKIWVNH